MSRSGRRNGGLAQPPSDPGKLRGMILDAGLQPERTELAWRRTVLALTLGGIVSLRILPPVIGAWGVAAGVGGTIAGVTLAVLAARRAAGVASSLRASRPLPPAGALLAGVALVAFLGAVVAAFAVAAIVAGR
jgi:uncharacterized membrane protein YidH (DUF202 family)